MIAEMVKRKLLEVGVILGVVVGFFVITNLICFGVGAIGVPWDNKDILTPIRIFLVAPFFGLLTVAAAGLVVLIFYGIGVVMKDWIEQNRRAIKKKHNYLFGWEWLTLRRATLGVLVVFFLGLGWTTYLVARHNTEVRVAREEKEAKIAQRKAEIAATDKRDRLAVIELARLYRNGKITFPFWVGVNPDGKADRDDSRQPHNGLVGQAKSWLSDRPRTTMGELDAQYTKADKAFDRVWEECIGSDDDAPRFRRNYWRLHELAVARDRALCRLVVWVAASDKIDSPIEREMEF